MCGGGVKPIRKISRVNRVALLWKQESPDYERNSKHDGENNNFTFCKREVNHLLSPITQTVAVIE